MKTVKFKVGLNIGQIGERTDELEVEVEDNATLEEIEKACDEATTDWANNYIEYWFDIIETTTNPKGEQL